MGTQTRKTKTVRRRLLAAAAGSALLALTGCASQAVMTQTDQAAVGESWTWQQVLPEGVRMVPTAEVNRNWWREWQNPELTGLIDAALAKNTDIKSALANLRSAAASADDATASLFPTLDLSGSGSASRVMGEASTTRWGAQGEAAWSMSLAGGNIAARRAAVYEAAASLLSLEDVRITVAGEVENPKTVRVPLGEVAQNYIGHALACVKYAVAAQMLKNYSEAAQIAQWRFNAGLADQAELDQAMSNREASSASLAMMRQSITQYKNALARLTVTNVMQLKLTEPDAVPSAPAAFAVAVPAQTLSQRPDMRAAELTVAAVSDRVYEARSQWFPALTISGNLGTQAATIATLGASGTGIVALAGALSMPLLNWGKQVTASEQALAQLDQARASYTATLVTALEETENALTMISTAETRKKPLQRALSYAESAADLTMQQYKAGLVDYQNVLTTQRTLLSALESTATNDADLATGLVMLYRALGGGWEPADEVRAMLTDIEKRAAEEAAADKRIQEKAGINK